MNAGGPDRGSYITSLTRADAPSPASRERVGPSADRGEGAGARPTLFWAALGLELALWLAWQWAHLGGFQWSSDEGLYLMRVRLLQGGYALYRDIWTDQLPGLIELLRALAALLPGGGSVDGLVTAGRATIVALAGAGLAGTALLTRRLAGRAAALWVIPALGLAPNLFWLARAIISPDLPSIALGALALTLLGEYIVARRPGWLAASALVLAAALYIKATAGLCALVGFAWLAYDAARVRQWRPLAAWCAGVALPLGLALALHHPAALWAQFVGTQAASGSMELKIGVHAVKIAQYLGEHNWGLAAAAVAGAVLGWRTHRRAVVVGGGWLVLSLVALLVRSPLWPSHHLVVLLPPLALLGGLAVAELPARGRWWRKGLAGAALTAYAISLPGIVQADAGLLAAPTYQSAQAAVAFLQEHVAPGAMVISDYHIIPYRAGLLVPPELATLTKKRLQLGLLSEAELMRIAEARQAEAVLLWDEQLARQEAFLAWMRGRYALAFQWDYHAIHLRLGEGRPRYRQELTFGDEAIRGQVTLLGYDIEPAVAVDPGQSLAVTLYWRADEPPARQLVSFVHLVTADGAQVAQSDGLAFGEQHPSTAWSAGEVVADRRELRVPPDATPGVRYLSVGLYDDATRERLRLAQGDATSVTLDVRPAVRWPVATSDALVRARPLARFGELAELAGLAVEPGPEDQGLRVRLAWRALTPAAWPGPVAFLHVRRGGELLAQRDGPPGEGERPPYAWRAGEIVVDERSLPAWPNPEQATELYVGWYDPQTLQRLPVAGPDGAPLPNDELRLGEIVGGELR